jgi:hypothetical protein
MDPTAARLVEELQNLEREQWRIARKIAAVRSVLNLAGVELGPTAMADENEDRYARSHLFAGKPLIDSCERIIKDHQGEWLAKRRVAYLLERGGYTSRGRIVNSVECTLRRLASLERIEVKRSRGRDGNQYRWVPENWAPAPEAGSATQLNEDYIL